MTHRALLTALFALFLAVPARAHDPGLSSAHVQLQPDATVAIIAFNNSDFAGILPTADRDGDGVLSRVELVEAGALARSLLAEHIHLSGDAGRSKLLDARFELGENQDVRCYLWWSAIHGAEIRWSDELLAILPRGHRQYALLTDAGGSHLAESLLSASCCSLVSGAPEASSLSGGAAFLHLGVEHILIGYDHILFLLGLLLACARWRQILVTITTFTLAHSLTLIGAVLGVIHLPGVLVESTIALSIVYVGMENMFRRGEKRETAPWKVTFLFGLIHGFGFASVLADLGIGVGGAVRDSVVPLIAFNAGVELGQLAIAATVLPLLWCLSRLFGRKFTVLGSLAICIAGLFWFLERAVL